MGASLLLNWLCLTIGVGLFRVYELDSRELRKEDEWLLARDFNSLSKLRPVIPRGLRSDETWGRRKTRADFVEHRGFGRRDPRAC